MARIRIGPIIEGTKKYAPKAGKFIKDNRKELLEVAGALGIGEIIKSYKTKKETNQEKGKSHHRKDRYRYYKTKILTDLESKNRLELFQYALEIENFIQQIRNEEENEIDIKKNIHKKRIKSWNEILIQIQDKMLTIDYLEFIKIYNNTNYQSEYFKGFEGHVEKFKKLKDGEKYDELLKYIQEITGRTVNQIEKDFQRMILVD